MKTVSRSLLFLFSFIASSAGAATYDAVSDFSSSNPSGPWTYGTGVTGSSFTPMTVYTGTGCDGISGVACWQPPILNLNVPQITINNSGSNANFSTVTLPTGLLLLHPGQSTDTIVIWTAPATGNYNINGFFELLDVAPTGIIGSVFNGSSQIYTTGALTGPPASQSSFSPGGRSNFSLSASLMSGQTISFSVNNDGNFLNDSTGFDATITSGAPTITPEPGSILLLSIGIVSLCAMTFWRARLGA